MAYPVQCSNCGYELRDVRQTPCPKCGDTRRTVSVEARAEGRATARAEGSIVFAGNPSITVSSLIIPDGRTNEGTLISSTSVIWDEIARLLANDWSVASQIPSDKWEDLVAGAFHKAGYDEVILTPRSGDHGRDVIAIKRGIGCVKIIGSVKAYKPGNLVPYDDIRALLGVMSGERDVSKGIISTTSGFPPLVEKDPFIAPFMPTRLELMDGEKLQQWLKDLTKVP